MLGTIEVGPMSKKNAGVSDVDKPLGRMIVPLLRGTGTRLSASELRLLGPILVAAARSDSRLPSGKRRRPSR